ncbi:ATP-binding protein [Flammeovirga agarivorans]|uniref:histidine kinase n=1 Tax=Flammeovirga agarivorans TaxID=2726742 RepID=A0A7X8XWT1_9BACT|nr:ATP-binding protein [Flammeovirga agarivorans]NLR92524.1 tetratricopeptide repeat protein [Flammeovirga agarivorans]
MKLLYFLSFLLLSYHLFAVDPLASKRQKIDSLKQVNFQHEMDDHNIDALFQLSGLYYQYAPDSSIYYLNQALKIALQTSNQGHLQKVYHRRGVANFYKAEYGEALKDYFEAAKISESLKDTSHWNNSIQNIGKVYEVQAELDKALEYYQKGFSLLNDNSSDELKALAFSNMANINTYMENYDESISYHKQALAIRQKLYEEKKKGSRNALAYSYNDIAIVYLRLNKTKQALKAYQASYKILNEINDIRGLIHVCSGLSDTYRTLGDNRKALEYAKKGYNLVQQTGAKLELVSVAYQLAVLYEEQKDYYQALKFQKLSHDMYDSVYNQEKMREIADLENQVRFSQQEAENRLLTEQQKLQELKMKKQWFFLFSIIVICLILAVFLAYIIKQKNKKKTLAERLSLANEQLLTQQEKLKVSYQEIECQNERLNTLNEEKNHLIGVVAHDLRNPLTSALSLSQILESELKDEEQECISGVTRALWRMQEMITRILDVKAIEAGHLNLEIVEFELDEVVETVVEQLTKKAERKGIEVYQRLKPCVVLADPNGVRQILENLLSNAIKFSPKNERIDVEIEFCDQEKVRLSVRDHGPGLSLEDKEKLFGKFQRLSAKPTDGESSTGLGLSIAKKFTEAMKGKIHVESEEGKGAKFIVTLVRKVKMETR